MHKEQRRPFINLGPGTSAPELELELIIQTPLFPILLSLWTPNLAGWWFRMKGIHLTHRSCGHVSGQETLYLHIHKVHSPQNLVGCWIRMRESYSKSHVTFQLCGPVKNQKRHISSTAGPTRCISKAKVNTITPTGTKNAEMK